MRVSRLFKLPLLALCGTLVAGGGWSVGWAQDSANAFSYKPPLRGAPASRVGGGTRGLNAHTILTVLAPDHIGQTIQSQPTLYWYFDGPANMLLEVTVNDPKAVKPVLEQQMKSPNKPGIYSLSLADYGVVLQPGIEYEWFVALVPDPQQRSNDVLSGGAIKRVNAETDLQQSLSQSDKTAYPRIYAEHGLWYDSIEALSKQIDTGKQDLRAQRAMLLEGEKLKDAAAYDKRS